LNISKKTKYQGQKFYFSTFMPILLKKTAKNTEKQQFFIKKTSKLQTV